MNADGSWDPIPDHAVEIAGRPMLPERLIDMEGISYVRCYLHGLIPAHHFCDQSPSDHFCGDGAHPNHVDGEDHDDQATSHDDWSRTQSEKLGFIAHLHAKVEGPGGMTDGTCSECDYLWPCRTFHVAAGWGLGTECYGKGWCSHAGVKVDRDFEDDLIGVGLAHELDGDPEDSDEFFGPTPIR